MSRIEEQVIAKINICAEKARLQLPPEQQIDFLRLVKKFRDRAEAGLKKYGVTVERTDLTKLQWLNHLQDELMDAAVYCERLVEVFGSDDQDFVKYLDDIQRESAAGFMCIQMAIEEVEKKERQS